MAFDPNTLIPLAVGLALAGGALYVHSTSDTKIATAATLITGEVKTIAKDVLEKIDGLREALHGVASAHSVAAERHASLSAAHDKLDSRVSLIEQDLYRHPRVKGATE